MNFQMFKLVLEKAEEPQFKRINSSALSLLHRTGKGQFSFQFQRKAMPKNAQTTAQLHSSHVSKVMLKILQARL